MSSVTACGTSIHSRCCKLTFSTVSAPTILTFKENECNKADVSTFLRLGEDSAGGLIFRERAQDDCLAVVVDSKQRVRNTCQAAKLCKQTGKCRWSPLNG